MSALEIMQEGPIGGAAFNNEFGRPNLCGYFRAFEASIEDAGETAVWGLPHKPIMLAGGLGNIKREHIEKPALSTGEKIICLGGPAMLIGLGGGAASSMASGMMMKHSILPLFNDKTLKWKGAVRKLSINVGQWMINNPIAFIHDVGAGGLSNALPELVKTAVVGAGLILEVLMMNPGCLHWKFGVMNLKGICSRS